MPLTSRQRQLLRKQRRVKKLRFLKSRIKEAKDLKEKERLKEKISKISPWASLEGM